MPISKGMPLILGLVAVLFLSIGGAWFLSSPEFQEPQSVTAGQVEASATPPQALAQEPPPAANPRNEVLLRMARFLEEEKTKAARMDWAMRNSPGLPDGEVAAINSVNLTPPTLRSDILFLMRIAQVDSYSVSLLEEVQARIEAQPQACFDSLSRSISGLPKDAERARKTALQLIVDLSRRLGREREAEEIVRHEMRNAPTEADALFLERYIAELQSERAPAAADASAASEPH